ncbi:MAG: FHA domain-containing protein [Planctomycetota bacterium]
MSVAKFRIINSDISGAEFVLPEHPVTLGRIPPADIILPHPSVSRQHARAEVRDGRCHVTDLGSQNGIVVQDEIRREVLLEPGERFELGDVAIEFTVEDRDEAAAPPREMAPAVPDEEQAVARPGADVAERPVYIDDVFGPGRQGAEPQEGTAEKAAVRGARSALYFVGVVALILGLGAVAWVFAGRGASPADVLSVCVRVDEQKVIDLGKRVRERRGRYEVYIDGSARYEEAVYPAGSPGEAVASVQVDDRLPFMATVSGHSLGHTDVYLYGRGNEKLILRVVVTGSARPPFEDRQRSLEERLGEGKARIVKGKVARQRGALYEATQQFKEAADILRPVKTTEGQRAHDEAYDLFLDTREQIEEEYRELKRRAVVQYKNRDKLGALSLLRQIKELIPDPSDRRRQELEIIYDRIRYEVQKEGA